MPLQRAIYCVRDIYTSGELQNVSWVPKESPPQTGRRSIQPLFRIPPAPQSDRRTDKHRDHRAIAVRQLVRISRTVFDVAK